MAAATIIHYGRDEYQRVPAMREAGYEVHEAHSLVALRRDLKQDGSALVVMIAEGARHATEHAAAVVRQHTGAPLILFRRSNAPLDVERFDRVVAPTVPPAHWLFDTAVLVEQSRRLQEEMADLIKKAEHLHGAVQAAQI